jgi:hypothetical protein
MSCRGYRWAIRANDVTMPGRTAVAGIGLGTTSAALTAVSADKGALDTATYTVGTMDARHRRT